MFDTIMRKLFAHHVEHVEHQRKKTLPSPIGRTVLVVDGNSSRYNPSTLNYLRKKQTHQLEIEQLSLREGNRLFFPPFFLFWTVIPGKHSVHDHDGF